MKSLGRQMSTVSNFVPVRSYALLR